MFICSGLGFRVSDFIGFGQEIFTRVSGSLGLGFQVWGFGLGVLGSYP